MPWGNYLLLFQWLLSLNQISIFFHSYLKRPCHDWLDFSKNCNILSFSLDCTKANHWYKFLCLFHILIQFYLNIIHTSIIGYIYQVYLDWHGMMVFIGQVLINFKQWSLLFFTMIYEYTDQSKIIHLKKGLLFVKVKHWESDTVITVYHQSYQMYNLLSQFISLATEYLILLSAIFLIHLVCKVWLWDFDSSVLAPQA